MMTRLGWSRLPLLALALAVVLSACATTPPDVPPVPTSGASAVPSPSPTAQTASPTPSASPSSTAIVLAGDGLGGFLFGTSQHTVTTALTSRLGKPTETASGRACELDSHSPWAETVVYKNLWVEFEAKDAKKSSPRSLHSWGYQLNGPLPEALAVADGVPLDLSFAQLKAAYPGTKNLDLGLEDGTVAIKLPNKLTFYGVKKPEVLQGGPIGVCE